MDPIEPTFTFPTLRREYLTGSTNLRSARSSYRGRIRTTEVHTEHPRPH